MTSPTLSHPHHKEAGAEQTSDCPLKSRIGCVIRSHRCAAHWVTAVIAGLVISGLVLAAVVWQELLSL